jgi:hypothetical protein
MSAKKWNSKPTGGSVRATDTNAAQRPTLVESVNQLKDRLLKERLNQVSDEELQRDLQLAANESAALAWATAYPMLVLPELMAERSQVTEIRHSRQARIRERSRSKLSFAA